MRAERLVLDTNVLISAAIQPKGHPAAVLAWVLDSNDRFLVFSQPTWDEFVSRLLRPKFDRFVAKSAREDFIETIVEVSDLVSILGLPQGCRDPTDDKVIETALSGGAEALVTGDGDLLAMAPLLGLAIIAPRAFLNLVRP